MSEDGLDDAGIRAVLAGMRRVAVVGASNRPERPSYDVMAYLIERGLEVVPVNPGLAGQVILGRQVVARLDDAGKLDVVDVFRASAHVAPVVDDAIRLGARTVWMQIGVVDQDAARRARAAGLVVVMDRCPKIEFGRRPGLCPGPAGA